MPLQLPCIPVFQRSCCCSLRTGALCIGWLSMIASAAKFILLIMLIVNLQRPFLDIKDEDVIVSTVGAHSPFTIGLRNGVQLLHDNPDIKNVSISVVTVLCLVETIFTVMLLDGIHNEKPSQMLPFLLSSLFVLIASVLSHFLLGMYLASFIIAYGLLLMAFAVLLGVISLYIWAVLYNYYRELEERKHGNVKYEIFPSEKKLYFAGL